MYKIDLRNTRKGYGFGAIFLLAGLIFLILLSYITFDGMIKKLGMDASVEATHIDENGHYSDGSYLYSPIYYYEVDGKQYTCRTGYSSSTRVSDSKRMVYYNSDNPSDSVNDYTVKPAFYMYLLCLFPLIFVFVGSSHMIKVYKNVKKAKYLAINGQLIQNLEYTMERTNLSVNRRNLYAIAVDYTLPTGSKLHLVGDPRYDGQQADQDGLVDLLIDPNDVNNYYIDFNITYS